MTAVLKERFEEAVFRDIYGALRFALNFQHGNTKEPSLSRFQPSNHKSRGLGGLDGAAQAGLILAELGKLPSEQRALLTARFADSSTPCPCHQPCCIGYKESRVWGEAVNLLAEYALLNAVGSRISHYRLRRCSVMRYFGERKSFKEIAIQCGIDPATASAHHNRVVQYLSEVEKKAKYEIEGRLKETGVIE